MRKPIILSGKSDPDLISLYRALGKKEFIKLIKDSLRSLVRVGYQNEVSLPDGVIPIEYDKEDRIVIGLTFSDVKDADVTYLLDGCQPRMCGHFIKQVLRFHVGGLHTLPAFLNENISGKLLATAAKQVLFLGSVTTSPVSRVQKPVREKKERRTVVSRPVREEKPVTLKEDSVTMEEKQNTFSMGTESYSAPSLGNETFETKKTIDEEAEVLSLLDGLLGD